MAAVACNSLSGQLALSYSQPVLKSRFFPDIYTVHEETDNETPLCVLRRGETTTKQKSASLHRGVVRFAQLNTSDLSTTSALSSSKDSGIGSSDDNNNRDESVVECRDDVERETEETEEDPEFVEFAQTARKFTEANVETMTWGERRERMDNCLGWLRNEIHKMKKQDQSLMRQFMDLRSTIHQLKCTSNQQSLRATYLRNQASCANLGASDQSARRHPTGVQSPTRQQSSNLRSLASSSQSLECTSNLVAQKIHSQSSFACQDLTASGGNFKVSDSIMTMDSDDTVFDMDSYFATFDMENDSFYDDDDSDTFIDQPMAAGGGPMSALSEQPYMPQYRTRTVSLVTPHYVGRPGMSGYLARSRYMSFSTAKGRVESERAILE